MRCPSCASDNIKVLDTRESPTKDIRRRRKCLNCGHRFTTYEKIEKPNIYVIKKDKTKQEYSREKIKNGLKLACKKRADENQIEFFTDKIEQEILSSKKQEISSSEIGKIVLKNLRMLDPVAYLRFASIYRGFEDYSSFEKELKLLKKRTKTRIRNSITQVKRKNSEVSLFDKNKIMETILHCQQEIEKEDFELAEALTIEVIFLLESKLKEASIVTTNEIEDAIEKVLLDNNHPQLAKTFILKRQQETKLSTTRSVFLDVSNTIGSYLHQKDWKVKENANEAYSFSGLMHYAGSTIISNYILNEIYPQAVSDAHKKGYIHIHDLGEGVVGYCSGWSLKNLILWGFGGVPNKVNSKPAKHLRTLVNHIVNYIGCLQMEFAGAQAFSSVDTFLAPFVKIDNLTFKEVKQCMQELIFSLNIPSRWGSQYPFSNFTFDLICPEDLRNEKAIVGGKEQEFTYGDCQKEMNIINKAFLEVMVEGDASGAIFTFPIPTYNLTKDFNWNSEVAEKIFEVTAKYGIPYFQNYIGSDLDPKSIRAMCCRLNLNMLELINRPGHTFAMGDNTGSIGVVTINLNRLAYESKTEAEFFEKIEHYMHLAKESLEIKRRIVNQNMKNGLMPFAKRYLGHFNNHFSTIGLIGMNEACKNLIEEDITTEKGKALAIRTLNFMREVLIKFQRETNNLYNLEATPAEGASYRLARLDKKHYPNIITAGTEEPYLTNSSQLPVDFSDDVVAALEHQNDLQVLYTGGTIFHTFVGEKLKSGESCKALIKKIAYNTKIPYFSITPTFSVCKEHKYIPGEHWECPTCGKECEVYSRIVGYFRPVQRWNKGKREEWKDRKTFSEEKAFVSKFKNEKTGNEPDKSKLTSFSD